MSDYITSLNGKAIHRLIWTKYNREIPIDHQIHHINNNKGDNRLVNLMCVTRKQHEKLHLLPNRIRIKYKKGIKVLKI